MKDDIFGEVADISDYTNRINPLHTKVTDVMIDLETMALGPDAAIVQIGAVGFSVKDQYVDGDSTCFTADVDAETCFPYGGMMRQDAVDWWEEQGGFFHKHEPSTIPYALTALSQWFGVRPNIKRVWANHMQFDLGCLEFYYRRTGLIMPWTYKMPSDMPTLINLALAKGWKYPPRRKISHVAVEDAKDQANLMISACRHLGYLC